MDWWASPARSFFPLHFSIAAPGAAGLPVAVTRPPLPLPHRLLLFFSISAILGVAGFPMSLPGADAPPIPGAVKAIAGEEIVRLYKLPEASSEAVGAVTKGESLWIVPTAEDWCRAVTEDGVRGWALKKAFAVGEPAAIPVLAARGYTEGIGRWHALLGKEGWLTPPLSEILPPDEASPGAPFYATGPGDTRFYLNDRGERLTLPEHNPEGPFRGGLARVRWGNTAYGFVDASLKLVIPAEWSDAGNFSDGLARVRKDLTQGFIDKKGALVLDVPFDVILPGNAEFHEGLAAFEGNGLLHGFLDRQGNRVLEPAWTMTGEFSGSFCQVSEDDPLSNEPARFFYIDRTGKALRSDQWSAADDFVEGRALVHFVERDAYQFIDATGQVLANSTILYSTADRFSEGLAAVANADGAFGYLDLSGRLAIPHQFEWAGSFTRGHSWVRKDGQYAIIDKTGQPVTAWFAVPVAEP